jgi:membrane associated rhomboid family serine protease
MSWNPAEEQERPAMTRVVQTLIAITVGVAFLQATVVQPAEMRSLFAFREGSLSATWWTAFTYMFLHAGLLHLALNMYTLWIFGPRLEAMWGARGFALFFVWCGLGGAVAHAAFGGGSPVIGASAAVYGIMLAYAMQWPKDEIHLFAVLPMRVLTLVALLVVLDLVRGIAGGGETAYFAHLGGVAFAFLYLKKPQHMSVDQLRQRVSPAPDVGDDISPRPGPRTSKSRNRDEVDEIVAQSKAAVAKRPARMASGKRPEAPRDPQAQELDRVLDKISRHGIQSLTPAEKRLLEDTSRQMRNSET